MISNSKRAKKFRKWNTGLHVSISAFNIFLESSWNDRGSGKLPAIDQKHVSNRNMTTIDHSEIKTGYLDEQNRVKMPNLVKASSNTVVQEHVLRVPEEQHETTNPTVPPTGTSDNLAHHQKHGGTATTLIIDQPNETHETLRKTLLNVSSANMHDPKLQIMQTNNPQGEIPQVSEGHLVSVNFESR
jgi:hypothetical protein